MRNHELLAAGMATAALMAPAEAAPASADRYGDSLPSMTAQPYDFSDVAHQATDVPFTETKKVSAEAIMRFANIAPVPTEEPTPPPTPTPEATYTATPTATPIETATATPTATVVETATPTATAVETATVAPTAIATATRAPGETIFVGNETEEADPANTNAPKAGISQANDEPPIKACSSAVSSPTSKMKLVTKKGKIIGGQIAVKFKKIPSGCRSVITKLTIGAGAKIVPVTGGAPGAEKLLSRYLKVTIPETNTKQTITSGTLSFVKRNLKLLCGKRGRGTFTRGSVTTENAETGEVITGPRLVSGPGLTKSELRKACKTL